MNEQLVIGILNDLFIIIKLVLHYIYSVLYLWFKNIFIPSKYLYKNVDNEICLITGAAKGIGKLLAKRFLKLNCFVICVDIDETELNKTVNELNNEIKEDDNGKEKRLFAYKLDVSSYEQVVDVAKRIKNDVGLVTILINNAGIVNGKNILDLEYSEIKYIFDVNIMAHFWLCKQFLPDMINLNKGHIVNVSSVCGIMGGGKLIDYCSTKFAVYGFTESLRLELKESNINNNIQLTLVCPFHIKTTMFKGAKFKYLNWLGLSMEPDYAADCIVHGFLLNKDVIYIPRFITTILNLAKGLNFTMSNDYANLALSSSAFEGFQKVKFVLSPRLKRFIKITCWLLYTICVCVLLPILIYIRNKSESSRVDAWFIGGLFVLATLPLSMYSIISHALNYQKPNLQKYIIRILFMVPIYALNSWVVLRFPQTSIYLDTFRECYEAFVIYNFMVYLCNYLKDEVRNFSEVFESKQNINLLFPLCLFPSCSNGIAILNRCKFGVLQYTLVRVLTSCISFICYLSNVYNEGDVNFKYAWVYLVMLNNFSQMTAMYCLVLFYMICKEELMALKPHPVLQFLCIKFVVFCTFWQAVLIAILVKCGVISTDRWPYYPTIVETANGLQDFIICIEMFLAAIAHIFAFPVTPFKLEVRQNWIRNILNAANVSDVHSDVVEHCKRIRSKVKILNSFGNSSSSNKTRSQDNNDTDEADEGTSLLNSNRNSFLTSGSTHQINTNDIDSITSINSNIMKKQNPDSSLILDGEKTDDDVKLLNIENDQDMGSLINFYPSSIVSAYSEQNSIQSNRKENNNDIDEIANA